MDLSLISNSELLKRLEKLACIERKITHLILWHINEVESRRLYAELGFDSMFKYLTQSLGYGEDSAYRRLQAARLLKQAPKVAEKLESGALNLTQLTQVQKCIKQELKEGRKVDLKTTEAVLEKIENKTSFETLKCLAKEFNQPIQIQETVKPQQDNSVRLEITFTEEQMEILKKAKDALSHVLPDNNWADLFAHLAKKHLQKEFGKDALNELSVSEMTNKRTQPAEPIQPHQGKLEEEKENKKNLPTSRPLSGTTPERQPAHGWRRTAKQSQLTKPKTASDPETKPTQSFTTKRKHIKITLKRELLKKANHCCEYINPDNGQRCQSTYQLQVDHRIPLARKGTDTPENLRVLCRTHNLYSAKKWGLVTAP